MTNYRKRLWASLYNRPKMSVVTLIARLVTLLAVSVLLLALTAAWALGDPRPTWTHGAPERWWQCMTVADMHLVAEAVGLPYAPPPPGGCASYSVEVWQEMYSDFRAAAYHIVTGELQFLVGYERLRWHEAVHYLQHKARAPFDEEQARSVYRKIPYAQR